MAFILSQIIKKKLPEWNKKVFTEDDFYELADRLRLPIVVSEVAKAKGEYLVADGNPIILLKPKLKCSDNIWVLSHEFGHHFLHHPVPHKFSKGLQRRMDREANFFALIALIPTVLVESKTLGEIMEEYSYEKDLVILRKEIYEAYKI